MLFPSSNISALKKEPCNFFKRMQYHHMKALGSQMALRMTDNFET